jgi:hypothetical protein
LEPHAGAAIPSLIFVDKYNTRVLESTLQIDERARLGLTRPALEVHNGAKPNVRCLCQIVSRPADQGSSRTTLFTKEHTYILQLCLIHVY